MIHHLTIGQSLQGKTTLNVELARGLRRHGIRCAVLDVLRSPEWPADEMHADPDRFLSWCLGLGRRRERWALFVDEGGLSIGRDPRFNALTTTARHLGIVTHLICHSWKSLLPELRNSCGRKWIFNNGQGADMARDEGRPELRQCLTLRPGEFFYIHPHDLGATGRGRLVWPARPKEKLRVELNRPAA
jgi:hypothetical protein